MDLDLAGFIGLAALMAALVARLRADLGGRLNRLATRGATLSGIGERLTRVEAAQHESRERMDGPDAELRAELHAVRADLAQVNERMARIEGAVAGALERPFPELTTRPAGAAAAE